MLNTIKNSVKNTNHWLTGALISLPGPSFASSSGITLVSIVEHVIVSGYLFLFQHRIQKTTFISIAAGMGIILGGSTLADELWG